VILPVGPMIVVTCSPESSLSRGLNF
jgi:hypothetical protein